MSDTLRPQDHEQQPQVIEAEPPVPHSGLLEGDGREGLVEVFDNTSLREADEQNLLAVPETVPLDVEQPLVATRSASLERPGEPRAKKKSRKWRLPLAGVVAATAVSVGAFVATRDRDSGEERTQDPIGTTASPATSPALAPLSPETTVRPEVVDPAFEPVLMTASTGEGLLEQFKSNVNCMVGNGPINQRERCFDYIVGGENGALTSLIRGRMDQATSYYAANPDESFSIEMALVDSEFEPNGGKAVLIAKIADASGSSTKRYTFVPSPVEIVTGKVDNAKATAWILYKESTVRPGEALFDENIS